MKGAWAGPLALVALVAGCQAVAGLADFAPDDDAAATTGPSGQGGQGHGGEGPGGGSVTGTGGAPVTSSSSSSSSTTTSVSTTTTGGGCETDHLVIAEVRTRGIDDGNQDFVELLNPTSAPILLDPSFRLDARGEGTLEYATRWVGDGSLTVPPGGRVLLANDAKGNPLGGETPDAVYPTGIRDGGSLVLLSFEDVVDAVCFTCEEASLADDFVCEGTPFARATGCADNGDKSVVRKAQGGVEGCFDTGNNAADLEEASPSTPQGLD